MPSLSVWDHCVLGLLYDLSDHLFAFFRHGNDFISHRSELCYTKMVSFQVRWLPQAYQGSYSICVLENTLNQPIFVFSLFLINIQNCQCYLLLLLLLLFPVVSVWIKQRIWLDCEISWLLNCENVLVEQSFTNILIRCYRLSKYSLDVTVFRIFSNTYRRYTHNQCFIFRNRWNLMDVLNCVKRNNILIFFF